MSISEFFGSVSRAAIAFSGGVDSSYLLYAAKTAGCDVRAYFVNSGFQPEFERTDARTVADSLGVPLHIIKTDALAIPEVAANGSGRCYYCKTAVMTNILERARRDGYDILYDGTNADDDASDRPGMRALRELGVVSPLRECGLTKADIRRLSKEAGLVTHDKPAYACLATRIPTGTEITPELLVKLERAESALLTMGFTDFRVRYLPPDGVKLQVTAAQMTLATEQRESVLTALSGDFCDVLLDMRGR